tara:strand:- start:76 stop:273 length:198 start_codon:yes stop_codon:yes gene_type:complete
MPSLDNPLTQEHLEKIIEGIKIADDTIRAINRASKTGIDLAGQLEEVRLQRKQLMALRNEYFPGL